MSSGAESDGSTGGGIPNAAWMARVWKATSNPAGMSEGKDMWAAVVRRGDRAEGAPDTAPLKGLRVELYTEEMHARVAAANALAALPPIEGEERVSDVQRRYVQAANAPPFMTLRALRAQDAGLLGGNRAAARNYWQTLEARLLADEREARETDEHNEGEDRGRADGEAAGGAPASAGESHTALEEVADSDYEALPPAEVGARSAYQRRHHNLL